MTRVKLLVFLFYVHCVFTLCHNYCKICRNHTLCKFPVAGPSPSCVKYDGARFLTHDDIEIILNKINDRRNFIALSRSKYLPGAANMRKVVWSHELADFAQRWVDQCDPSTRPDKEDDCRNLETSEVGQNIATMSDLSPGFNVKSFVEMWYMQSLDYSGSVTFYNKADNRTKYFTQLIWANTDIVGCGQASFYVENLRITLRRFVCNFAPSGNILGKPVYIIGYPATQCPASMVPDVKYKGLCTFRNDDKQMTKTSPVTSLLRIINLSDSPELLNNQTSKSNESCQIAASMFINTTHAAVKRYPHNFWSKTINHSKPHGNCLHEGENHQRFDHLIDPLSNLHTSYKNTDHISNKYEGVTTPIVQYSNPNFRKNYQPSSCTRKVKILRDNCDTTDQDISQCTRGQSRSKLKSTITYSTQTIFTCPCDSSTTTSATTSTTTENTISYISCPCLNKDNIQVLCSNIRRQEEATFYADKHKSSTFYNYDLLPNLHVGQQMGTENLQNKFSTYPLSNEGENLDGSFRRKGFIEHYRNRQKRDGLQYATDKPFWKMDDSLLKRTLKPKAARYTTIANRKIKKTKVTTIVKSTEPITVTLISIVSTLMNKQSVVTEKYLSFDELMQLRKMNMGGDHEARRKGAEKTTKAASTTKEITANTPFIRMKHCTRKLTCTWTIPKFTDCNGSVIPDNNGGGGSNRGSRTPPGYVDGCTRTSTCTRDFLDRNKYASTTEENTELPASTSEVDDDDYCERRSLKIKRRNSYEEIKSSNYGPINLDFTTILPTITVEDISTVQMKSTLKDNNVCVCNDFTNQERGKRNYILNSKEYMKYHKKYGKKDKMIYYEEMHYGELYFKILEKLKETWEKSKRRKRLGTCFCNGSSSYQNKTVFLFLFLCTSFINNIYY